MDQDKIWNLLQVARGGLTIAGILFLIVALVGNIGRNWLLGSALGCILLSRSCIRIPSPVITLTNCVLALVGHCLTQAPHALHCPRSEFRFPG